MAVMTTPHISADGISRHFGGLIAVDQVDFAVPRGEIRAIIGPNGAGKSTFVGMLCGRIPVSAGRIMFDGKDVTALPAHKRIRQGIAYTFQITSIYGRLSLQDNVRLATSWRWGNDERAIQNTIEESLEKVGLADRMDQMAGDLSYGHQRLLEIAMGISQHPQLLILDEPTQGLADSEIAGFVKLIRELGGDMTILLIEHNMNVVMDTADQITVLNLGKVLATGTPADIRANREVQIAYLGETHA
ncbi:ABC transporter ATP-binding protein [Alphaproteobacteria bacterium]|jgi:branched-chain amino acid transport system ATP-binding protein|nr:ABC transporter ATP-binding protein [Alphaproteobacteria bacterium]